MWFVCDVDDIRVVLLSHVRDYGVVNYIISTGRDQFYSSIY